MTGLHIGDVRLQFLGQCKLRKEQKREQRKDRERFHDAKPYHTAGSRGSGTRSSYLCIRGRETGCGEVWLCPVRQMGGNDEAK